MPFDRKTFVIPDETTFEGKLIWTHGDIVIENEATMDTGLKTDGRIFAGERVHIAGDLHADGDIRIDLFSQIEGDITSHGNVYIGEGTRIGGHLSLDGDLDVGKNVQIPQGFEAKGWINIRGSIPIIIYLFIYLVELLKRGHSEEVERILSEIDDTKPIPISDTFFFIPKGSSLAQDAHINGNIHIGKKCKLTGNYRVKGNAYLGKKSILYGALRATGEIMIQDGAQVEGNIECDGKISVGKCQVGGDMKGEEIVMSQGAVVKGVIHAPGGIRFTTKKIREMEEKVGRIKDNVDVVDEVGELLQ